MKTSVRNIKNDVYMQEHCPIWTAPHYVEQLIEMGFEDGKVYRTFAHLDDNNNYTEVKYYY